MKRRRAKDYNAIFSALKREAKVHGLELKPEYFMVDFEIAELISFKKYLRKAVIKGCLFHFASSLFKNLTKHHLNTVQEQTLKQQNRLQLDHLPSKEPH